jgi:carbon-monoxide dehydrogenase large subunit
MNHSAVIGDVPHRREDARFVAGHGGYPDDLRFDGVTPVVFLRSPHTHARIIGTQTIGQEHETSMPDDAC